MATTKSRTGARRRRWLPAVVVLLAVAGGTWFVMRDTISGYGEAGTSYGAKNACSCRFVAGRELSDCEKDFLPGMEAVFLSEDESERSVTAYIPLVASNTATWREGFGCMLEDYEG